MNRVLRNILAATTLTTLLPRCAVAADNAFKAIKFVIDEVELVLNTWAYARTRSSGMVKVLGTQLPPGAEASQELFLLRKEPDGQWHFARYVFSTTNPPVPR